MDSEPLSAPRAQIACITGDEKSLAALTTTFARASYVVTKPADAARADLGLVDLRQSQISTKKAKAISGVLRKKSPECSIFFLVDSSLNAIERGVLKRFGEVVLSSGDNDHLIERCRQMIRLRNIAEETGERLKSLASLNRLVEFPAILSNKAPLKILLAGAPGPATMAVTSAVNTIAEQVVCVFTTGQMIRALDHKDFDCVIFIPHGKTDPLHSLVKTMRRHPNHSGIPVIHIADDDAMFQSYVQKGARDLILHKQVTTDLTAKVQMTARRAGLSRSMRGFLQACNGEGIRDSASGAFTSTFLSEHGARLCARADQTGRPLALTLTQLSIENNANADMRPGRAALHQAARLINRITRAEDLLARIGPDKFITLSSATNAEDATRAAMRIEGVLTNTVFRGVKNEVLYSVGVETHICMRAPGASIEESVAATLKAVRNSNSTKQPRSRSPQ